MISREEIARIIAPIPVEELEADLAAHRRAKAMSKEEVRDYEEKRQVQRVLNIQDDERLPATPQQPQVAQGQVAINLGAAGMTVTINQQPINLTIDEEGMNQMVAQWLASHPVLMDELIKKRGKQKQTELTIIRDIRSAKLH